jgi:hypothetical protein
MSFFKKLSNLFSSPGVLEDASYWLTVKCNRCGETIRARVDLRNDLSIEYSEDGVSAATYFCRKTLMGEGHCFQRIEVELTFDIQHKLLNREISGGQFVDD